MNEQKESDNLFADVGEYEGFTSINKKRKVISAQYDFTVEFMNQQITKKKIILDVPFQRSFIWKKEKSSKFIESILLNVPVPPIYFAEDEYGNWLVLDGLQRLTSIFNFYKGSFTLDKLTVLDDLNGKKYSQLDEYQTLLDTGLLRVNVISRDSDPDVKYDVFMRLNQGAETLNFQELRNCLYRGSFNDALKGMCKDNTLFLKILKEKKPHKRFLDVELILRYFAFSDSIRFKEENGKYYVDKYEGKLVQFLNEYMRRNMNADSKMIESYVKKFNSTIDKVLIVFSEEEAFRNIISKRNKIYRTIADFIMTSFEKMDKSYIKNNKGKIRTEFESFLKEKDSLISTNTSNKDVVNERIDNWFSRFRDGIRL